MITVNGSVEAYQNIVEASTGDSLGRSVIRVPRSSGFRGSDGGASKARHNRDDDKVWSDGKWDLR